MNDQPKVKIMIVEDETQLLDLIQRHLKDRGFDTVSCTTGRQAVNYLRNLDQNIGAIWLDYHLKDMEGIEFLKFINSNEKLKLIPIFIVSNSASYDKVLETLSLGAKRYFLKAQHRLDEIVQSIEDYLKQTNKNI